jgi:hypothetical protein
MSDFTQETEAVELAATELPFEDWLDEIRIRMYEETKNMSNADIGKLISGSARAAAEEYGFQIIKESPYATHQKLKMNISL